jgi:hypothetical protein
MPSRLVKIWLAASQKKIAVLNLFRGKFWWEKQKFFLRGLQLRGKLEQLIYTYYITIN